MNVLTVLGARPQIIKASVVSASLRTYPAVHECVVHTGQHFDTNMSEVFFEELGMRPPNIRFDIHGGDHGEMTGRMLVELEPVMLAERPDVVLVYGDTNSTLAGALAAAKLHIPVAHVEAGLRSFNRQMPEEVNRVLTDHLATWLFAPTEEAVKNLRMEGIKSTHIYQVGDVMYDVALFHGQRAEEHWSGIAEELGLSVQSYVLATIHRAENTDESQRLAVITEALKRVAKHLPVVWPLHPRTRGALNRLGLWSSVAEHLNLIEPQGYLDMVTLERHAAVIATDSGGVQKEAFFHRVPCVTLRDESEWVELLELGWNHLVPPTTPEPMCEAILRAVNHRGQDAAPYGNGHAAEHIVACLLANLI